MDFSTEKPEIAIPGVLSPSIESQAPNPHPTTGDSTTGLKRAFVYGTKNCGNPDCDLTFEKKKSNERFCSAKCKDDYWRLAAQIGDRILGGTVSGGGKSQTKRILEVLQSKPNQWVGNMHHRIPGIVAFSRRISDLRAEGHEIECRAKFRDDSKHMDYQYKLVVKVEGTNAAQL